MGCRWRPLCETRLNSSSYATFGRFENGSQRHRLPFFHVPELEDVVSKPRHSMRQDRTRATAQNVEECDDTPAWALGQSEVFEPKPGHPHRSFEGGFRSAPAGEKSTKPFDDPAPIPADTGTISSHRLYFSGVDSDLPQILVCRVARNAGKYLAPLAR